jgi:tRNA A37 threonylcarbamoyladenosine biosynthesis protein TsaE
MKSNIQLRNEEISTLLEVIRKKEFYKENSEHGLVILLNGEWGTGKTTFINQFVGMINSQDDIELFNNYNAYENDYYENAYIPFFASIDDKIKLRKEFTNFIKSVGGATGKGLVVVSYAITKSIFKKKFDIDVDDIKNNLKEIQDEEVNNDLLNEYKDFHKYKNKIKESMNSICKNKTQIFIIDELDRCKPSFAMETLEIVKHFFDVKNCVFIIAVDKVQLEESIKTIYGNGINSEKYFSKLFDYQFNLLPISFYDSVDITDMPNANSLDSSLTNSLKELVTTDIFEKLKSYKNNAVIITGTEYTIDTDYPEIFKKALESMPQAEKIVVDGADHGFTKHREELIQYTVDFVKENTD